MVQPRINDPLDLIRYLQNNSGGSDTTPAQDLNFQQDVMSSVFNPQFAAAYNMFDPVGLAPAPFQYATPVLTGSLNSATPVWQQVAQAIMDGTIDRQNAISAVAEALGIDEYSVGAGLTIDDVKSQIDAMFKEAGDKQNAFADYETKLREDEQSNVYGKAGLRQPYEEYTLQDAPFSQGVFDQQAELEKMLQTLTLSEGKQRQTRGADTQAIYTKMMEQDKAAQDALPSRLLPKSSADAKQLAKTLGVDEGWMMDIYNKSFGLGTVQVYDQEKGKYVDKTFTPAEKEEAFKTFINNEINKGTSGTGSLIDDWISGNDDERAVKVADYIAAGKPAITGKRKESQNQQARRGMAMSAEAEKQAKAKSKMTDRYIAAQRFGAEQEARKINARKMAQLQNLMDAGRTPTGDQINQRLALFGLGNSQ